MPSDPEKQIEPLLKAYAEKRRQAGGQGELHPASRRMLQAEVRRRWPAGGPDKARRWYHGLAAFWPRLAIGGAIALFLGLGLWFWNPAGESPSVQMAKEDSLARAPLNAKDDSSWNSRITSTRTEPPPTSAVEANELRLKLADAQKDKDSKDSIGPVKLLQEEESIRQRGIRDGTAPTGPAQNKAKETMPQSLAAEPAPAAPVVIASPITTPAAPSRPGDAPTSDRSLTVANQPVPALLPPPATPAPIPVPQSAAKPATDPKLTIVAVESKTPTAFSFQESAPASQSYFRNTTATPQSTLGVADARRRLDDRSRAETGTVLVNFAIEQRGPALRIIDNDGSVYEGRVLARPEAAVAGTLAKSVTLKREEPAPAPTRMRANSTSTTGPASQDNYSYEASPPQVDFEVFGTNKTLRQSISLTGKLILNSTNAATDASARFQQSAAGGARRYQLAESADAKKNQAATNSLQVLRVLGRGRVSGSNEIAVDAVPVAR